MKKKPVDPIFQTFFDKANIGSSDQAKLLKRLPISISFLQTLGVGIDDVPTEEHMKQLEAHLHTLTQDKGRYKGKTFEDTTIQDWVNRTRDFFTVRNGKRSDDKTTTEPKITIPEFEAPTPALNPGHEATPAPTDDKGTLTNTPKGEHSMTTENSTATAEPVPVPVRAGNRTEIVQPEAQQEASPEGETPEAPSTLEASRMGRPRKSPEGRNKKLTIYITEELEEDVKDLARIVGTTTPDYVFRLIEREAKNRAEALGIIRKMRLENA